MKVAGIASNLETIQEVAMEDIRKVFGLRVRELRMRCGMSQEVLAFRAGLDRSYISDLERGTRNVTILNIEKIASALTVSLEYIFSNERFPAKLAYQQKDLAAPFQEKFQYHFDSDTRVLAFTVKGLLTPEDVDSMGKHVFGVCSNYKQGEISLLIDHRSMCAKDGEPAIYSPEVAEKAVQFQQTCLKFSKKAAVLCNSQFMVENLRYVTMTSGFHNSHQLFGKDRDMVQEAYSLIGIHDNPLVKQKLT